MKKNQKRVVGIDLFCGAGGLTCGLQKSGIKIVAGYDIDPASKYPFEENNKSKFIQADIREVKGKDIKGLLPKKAFTLIAGCAPCQPFSSYTNPIKSRDEKWSLLDEFARIVKEAKPDFVTMENVPNLERQDVFNSFTKCLTKNGYHYTYKIVSCPEYGIPQSRRRLVLLASRKGPIEIIPPSHKKEKYVTVKDAIGYLPPIKDGERHISDPLHVASKLSPTNLKRIKHSRQGGTWKDWPKSLVAKCHKKKTGSSYPSVYGRMSWNKPGPTMTTQCYGFGNGRFGHPQQNRAISLREAALLQTFPKSYKFLPTGETVKMKEIGTLIGNAVPVKLGEVIAASIAAHLEKLK